jgi:hypothetical protein
MEQLVRFDRPPTSHLALQRERSTLLGTSSQMEQLIRWNSYLGISRQATQLSASHNCSEPKHQETSSQMEQLDRDGTAS